MMKVENNKKFISIVHNIIIHLKNIYMVRTLKEDVLVLKCVVLGARYS